MVVKIKFSYFQTCMMPAAIRAVRALSSGPRRADVEDTTSRTQTQCLLIGIVRLTPPFVGEVPRAISRCKEEGPPATTHGEDGMLHYNHSITISLNLFNLIYYSSCL